MTSEKERSCGGLWVRKDRNGKTYLSGEIEINGEKTSIVVFKNERHQEGERTPQYRIYPKLNREQRSEEPAAAEDTGVPF